MVSSALGNRQLFRAVPYLRYQICCTYSTDFKPLKRTELSDLKRGTGGRSSFNGIVATVFGASGFLGRYVANKLGKIGTQTNRLRSRALQKKVTFFPPERNVIKYASNADGRLLLPEEHGVSKCKFTCHSPGIVATVFDASSFLGRYVANKLGKIGIQLILPYRGDAYEVLRLRLVGDLGQVLFQPYDLKDENSIRKCLKYSNVVINLVGRDWETKNYSFDEVHVKGARRLAKIAREAGIETFIHVSALNATPNPEAFMVKGGSKWLKSKWDGENAVREEFPDAVIFRPSDIYGQEDRFLRYYCGLWRHNMKWMPLYKKGECTEKQPVFVSDVAAGIVAACKDRSTHGKIYQAVGPNRYLLSELVDWFHRLIKKSDEWGYRRYDLRYDPFFQARISLMPQFTLGHPIGNVHWERIEREIHSDKVERNVNTLEDLGIHLTRMEDQVPWEVRIFRAHSYAEKELMEFDSPEPPQTIVV